MEGTEEGTRPEKIFVSVRVRPLNEKEISSNDVSDWECVSDNTIFYRNANVSVSERSMYPTAYTFDRVFGTGCSTRQVYEQGAKEVALSAVRGINSSVFAYGQTSSGKTYTMTGITEYTIEDIYEYIQQHAERDFLLKFSAMEIYNESVRDLLSADMTPLRLLDDPERGTVVEKLIEETVRDKNHMTELLSICEAQRQIGETFLNETSSRSHQIIRLTIESSAHECLGRDNSSILSATVDFVDLAGSERASQSLSAGARLKEGCHINRSLLTLGTVIRKLSKGRSGHIPYRDSKLTRILQPSLGGNARTAVICTMSPARVQVEQSRNTLLFATCAKEVSINAQVNVVMSDKALVKHLQRELARLENELRNPGSTSIMAEYAALLREKEIQIEKLENDMRDLHLQRDMAQARLKEVLQILGVDEASLLQEAVGNYPNLWIHKSPESGKNHTKEESDSPEDDARAWNGEQDRSDSVDQNLHNRSDSEDQYLQVTCFGAGFLQNNSPPWAVNRTLNFYENGSCLQWDEIEKQSNWASEDLCKEVRCIETKAYSSKEGDELDYLYPDENIEFPELGVIENENDEDQESVSSEREKEEEVVPVRSNEDSSLSPMPSEEEQAIALPALNGKRKLESPLMEEKELSCIHSVNIFCNDKSSSPRDLTTQSSGSRSKTLTKSKSCKASLVTDLSSSYFEEVNKDSSPPCDSDRNVTVKPGDLDRKFSVSEFATDVEMILSRRDSHSSTDSAVDIKLALPDGRCCTHDNSDAADACYSELKEKVNVQQVKEVELKEKVNIQRDQEAEFKEKDKFHQDEEVPDSQENEHKDGVVLSWNVKDVGLDPIEDETKNLSSWPSDFEKLQKEIIKLWDACYVSLVHRTYFFLLFQDDPTDAIYMEVELRRLSFLSNTFARGEKTIMGGRTVSLESSIKALRQERRKLSKKMLKKLSEQERESLFLKWGIGLDTKLRRLQLAHCLWSSREDTDRIKDSAYLVAKLVGFIEPGKAPKEIFSLDFSPRFVTKTFSFKRSLLALRF